MIIVIVLFFLVLYGLGLCFYAALIKGQDRHFAELDKIRRDSHR